MLAVLLTQQGMQTPSFSFAPGVWPLIYKDGKNSLRWGSHPAGCTNRHIFTNMQDGHTVQWTLDPQHSSKNQSQCCQALLLANINLLFLKAHFSLDQSFIDISFISFNSNILSFIAACVLESLFFPAPLLLKQLWFLPPARTSCGDVQAGGRNQHYRGASI